MSTELATASDNYFLAYGEAADKQTIVGDILKFTKFGEWVAGKDGKKLKPGTRLIANLDELLIGHVKWEDSKAVDHRMGRLVDGFRPEEGLTADDGWQKTNYLALRLVGADSLFTYAPSSKSGLKAVGLVCKAFGLMVKGGREEASMFPVLELNGSSYIHDEFGEVRTPDLKVVGWVPKDAFGEMPEPVSDEPVDEDTSF